MALTLMENKVFLRLREIQIEFPDGLVLHIGKVEPVKKGWVVKMMFGQNLEGQDGMMKALTIAAETTDTVAGWKDGESELWDVVLITESEEEATEIGKQNGNMSIYQIETGTLKWID